MNSLRGPRSRPRRRSVCFRSLWYVLMREAFLVTLNVELASRAFSSLRYELARASDQAVRERWQRFCAMQGYNERGR